MKQFLLPRNSTMDEKVPCKGQKLVDRWVLLASHAISILAGTLRPFSSHLIGHGDMHTCTPSLSHSPSIGYPLETGSETN